MKKEAMKCALYFASFVRCTVHVVLCSVQSESEIRNPNLQNSTYDILDDVGWLANPNTIFSRGTWQHSR